MEESPVDVGKLRLWQGKHLGIFQGVNAYGSLDQPTHFQVVQASGPLISWLPEAAADSDRIPLDFEFRGRVQAWRGRGKVQYRSARFLHVQPVGSLELIDKFEGP